jgi:hypothetical protein
MTIPARRRIVYAYRLMQSWPLLYLGAAIVGFIICASGWITGKHTGIRFDMWFTVPLSLFLGWLVLVLTISAIVNMGVLLWMLIKRWGTCRFDVWG